MPGQEYFQQKRRTLEVRNLPIRARRLTASADRKGLIHIPIISGKPLKTGFSLLLLFILSIQGSAAYGRSSEGNEPSADLPSIKVMSLNLHKGMDQNGTKILDGDLALFNVEQPDLIALQEVLSGHIKTFISAGYQVIYGPNLNLLPFHFGNVVLTRHPVLYHRHHYLPSQLELRGVDEVALDIDGQVVTVLNTHLGLEKDERAIQLTEIQRIIDCIPGPVILMGDFNTEPRDSLFTELKSRFGEIGDQTPGAKTCPASHPNRRLDQMWYNDYLGLIRGSVLSWLVSDHLPIEAEFKLLKANPTPAQLVIPTIPQAKDSLPVSMSELDSPEFQLGATAKFGAEFNQSFAEALFPLNLHWVLSAQHNMDAAKNGEDGVSILRVGYTSGAFDLRDYLSLLRIKGNGRWLFYACTDTEKAGWIEWNQAYRFSKLWETELTLALKNPESVWLLEQNLYLSEYLTYSLGIDTQNNLSTHITFIPQ